MIDKNKRDQIINFGNITSEDVVLETIRNRCQIFKLEPYSRGELELLVKLYNRDLEDKDLDFISTPNTLDLFPSLSS